jgi:carbonic anhydrase
MYTDLSALLEPSVTDLHWPATPAAALERLAAGNRRFIEGRIESPRRNLARMRELIELQAPFAAIVSCADSRVPSEVVFDQGYGELFETRVAGNVVTPEVIGSLEFAVAELGVQVVYVLGHTFCSAMAATARRERQLGELAVLANHLVPALQATGGVLPAAVECNARWQAQLLAHRSPVIAQALEAGTLALAAGVLDLHSGIVTPVALEAEAQARGAA